MEEETYGFDGPQENIGRDLKSRVFYELLSTGKLEACWRTVGVICCGCRAYVNWETPHSWVLIEGHHFETYDECINYSENIFVIL